MPDSQRIRTLSVLLAGAALAAACGDAPVAPDPAEIPVGTVSGKVVAPGISAFGDITARVRWGTQDETAPVAPDGTFAVPLYDEVEGFGTLTLEPGSEEPVHPGWILLTPGDVNGGQGTVVLAPRTWTIDAGTYAGTEVPIDPEMAADPRVLPSYWGFYFPYSQQGFLQTVTDNTRWMADLRSWPQDRFPLRLALDHPGSNTALAPEDSAAFWAHVTVMEEALGFDVFRPARTEELQILGGTRRAANAVLVQIDTNLPVRGTIRINPTDPQTYALRADARTWSGTGVQDFDLVSSDIWYGVVQFDAVERLNDRQLVIHELMHILGAGHGCSWASVQTYCASLATDVPTPADVAHLRVLGELRALELEHRTRWGVAASVFGHRVVTLGLAPIPTPSLVYGPVSRPGDWLSPTIEQPRLPESRGFTLEDGGFAGR